MLKVLEHIGILIYRTWSGTSIMALSNLQESDTDESRYIIKYIVTVIEKLYAGMNTRTAEISPD